MIEVASKPGNLTTWDGKSPPFYLEIFGETSPTVDVNYAEVLKPDATSAESVAASPIYEYWWTIGHAGHKPEDHNIFRHDRTPVWGELKDPAAHVYFFFPINKGWRIKELAATIKYLSPARDQKDLSEKAGADWQKISPFLADAGTISSLLKPVPVVGAGAAAAAPLLSALSKLQIGTVPSSASGFEWYVDKVTTAGEATGQRGVMQGVMWSIPKSMFEMLGGRLTGSLALSFIETNSQTGPGDKGLTQAALCGHAVVKTKDADIWLPEGMHEFVELNLSPQLPPSPASPTPTNPTPDPASSATGAAGTG